MKTITEFSGFTLKETISKKTSLLGEGKTEEEAQAAINEQLKLEEQKISFYKNAIDMTGSRIDRVKRVVVATKSSDTEKVPEAFVEREGHFYLLEFFPDPNARSAPMRGDDRDSRGGRGNDRGRGGGGRGREGGGRGNDRGRSNDRGAPRNEGFDKNREAIKSLEGGARPAFNNKPAGPRPPRAPRPEGSAPRGPRPPRAPQEGPKGAGELRLILKGQSQTTLQGSSSDKPQA